MAVGGIKLNKGEIEVIIMAVGGIRLNKGEIVMIYIWRGIRLNKGEIEMIKYGCGWDKVE
jgi:hypothetical protein